MSGRRANIFTRCILTWAAAFALWLNTAPAAPAEDAQPKPELRLEAQPSDITLGLATAPKAQLLMVAHNPSGGKVTGKLSFVAPPELHAKEVQSPSLPAAGDLSWLVEVT